MKREKDQKTVEWFGQSHFGCTIDSVYFRRPVPKLFSGLDNEPCVGNVIGLLKASSTFCTRATNTWNRFSLQQQIQQ